MKQWLVTLKLERNPAHDPLNKQVGACPVAREQGKICTDVTGQHHTVLVEARDSALAARDAILWSSATVVHVTRVEEV